ncbi:uncharacterized protein BKA78DRAFT_349501 [Phyllosticta capitalensis]|uniref:uncharacterized protein n=1 Tax=Phyllosticta capitalensis TaxID=121624 RepID=UPI00312F31E0
MFTSGKHSDHTVKLRNGRELRVHKAIVCKACARLWLTLSTHRNRIPASRRPPIVPFELGLVNVLSSLPFRFSDETEDWRKEDRLDALYDTIEIKEYDDGSHWRRPTQ